MGTTITFRRGPNDPTSGSGLTLAEPAFNTTLKTFHIGLGHGITAAWVGAPISGLSAEIAAGITYKTPTLKAVKDYVTDYVTAVNGVLTVNGFAGGVTLNAGTALGLTSSSGNITLTNLGVQSFNGLTGAVGGVCAAQTNTFTAVQTFNSGVTFASTIDATGAARLSGGLTASRIDVTGNFKVVGDAQIGDQNTDTLTVFSGTTFNNRVEFGGTNFFRYGLTSGGAIRFSGNNTKTIITSEASLTITGATSGPIATAYNSMVFGVQTTDPLTMYSATGVVDIATNNPLTAVQPALRFNTDDLDIIGPGSIKIEPATYATAARTQYLQNASGTIALTSQLMGAVNGSTAATTAVTSFNGLTGAVQGVSSVNGATGAVTNVAKTNEITSFSAASNLLTVTDTTSGNNISINPSTNKIVFYDDNSGNDAQLFVGSFGNQLITLPDSTCTLAGRDISQTFTSQNTFTALQTFSAGISAAGCTFSSTTNTLDVIASTEGAGLRIARATSGVGSRIGGIRLGRSATSSLNTYIEGSSGTFTLYNGVDNTGTAFASFSTSQFSLGTTSASFISLNCPNNISFGDTSNVGNNQQFAISGTNRTYAFGDPTGVTTGFVGINRSGLCGDYALEVNSPTGKGLQLIYNDHTGAASNWVNMDVSSGGNFTVRPSGGLSTVTGTLNVSAGVCAAGITLSAGGQIQADGGILYIGNNPASTTRVVIGDFDASGNSTYILVRDPVSALDIVNPFGAARMGDPDGINNGAYFTVDNGSGLAEIAAVDFTVNASTTVNGLLKPSSGISASGGVTFGGTVASDTGYRITSNAINAQTGTTYTFLNSDNGKVVTFNNGSAVTVTIPTALPVGFNCTAIQLGAGQVGFTAASGVTLQSYGNQYRLIGQHASASIIEYSTNIVNLSGNLVV